MRVGIVGSRKFKSKSLIEKLVKSLPIDSIIVSGGCAGPDKWAEESARNAGLTVSIFLPNLPPNDSPHYEFTKAFYARNRLIVENSDVIHAFINSDRIGGTEYTVKYAQKKNKPVIIHCELPS